MPTPAGLRKPPAKGPAAKSRVNSSARAHSIGRADDRLLPENARAERRTCYEPRDAAAVQDVSYRRRFSSSAKNAARRDAARIEALVVVPRARRGGRPRTTVGNTGASFASRARRQP
jgi:hypothetical protein